MTIDRLTPGQLILLGMVAGVGLMLIIVVLIKLMT